MVAVAKIFRNQIESRKLQKEIKKHRSTECNRKCQYVSWKFSLLAIAIRCRVAAMDN